MRGKAMFRLAGKAPGETKRGCLLTLKMVYWTVFQGWAATPWREPTARVSWDERSEKGSSAMENLDALLNKIRSEGVEAAKAEAAKVLAAAKAEAEAIVAKAKAEAEAAEAKAKAEAERAAQGAEATIRQAARDVVLKLGQDVAALLERTLGGAVDETLKPGPLVERLVAEAVASYLREGAVEVAVPEALVPALKARLAAQGEVTVVTDPRMGTGFKVRLAGGRVEHDFSGDSVTAALAALLRPQLAELLK